MQREGICCTFPLQFHELLNKLKKIYQLQVLLILFLKLYINKSQCLSVYESFMHS